MVSGYAVVTKELRILHEQVDTRVRSIRESVGGWPCRKGCDFCCRHLAASPRLTRAEWDLLRAGLERLPADVLREIGERMYGLPVCPLLEESGECRVYEHRPMACRTYGFYRERDKGLYCGEIAAKVERGECEDVVWGNAASVDAALGEGIPLDEWWRQWRGTCPRTESSSLAGS